MIDEQIQSQLDRIEAMLVLLMNALVGEDDDDATGPFGAERDGAQPL